MPIDLKAVLETFLAESDEDLGRMEQALLALETRPDDQELIKTIFRAAHTLKGNALALGFPALGELAHATEDLLADVRSGAQRADRGVISLLLRSLDALRELLRGAAKGPVELTDAHRLLIAELGAPSLAPPPPAFDSPTATGLAPPSVPRPAATPDGAETPKPPVASPTPRPPVPTPKPPPAATPPVGSSRPEAARPPSHPPTTVKGGGQRAPAPESRRRGADPTRRPTLTMTELPASATATASETPPRRGTLALEGRARTLRVNIGKLDDLLNIAGEIAINRGRVAAMLERMVGDEGKLILDAHREADRLYADLQDLVMKARMVPVGGLLRTFGRVVRDLSEARGKHVRLVIEGEDVEVNTAIVEHLRDPLSHMIRNAVDHGIEPAAIRKAHGKGAEGTIVLRASHEGGSIVVQISDDGRGLERQKILDKARARGLIGPHETLSDRDLLDLIFVAGFSTADTVTEISGRGVGMDVVRRNVEAIRGTVEVSSREKEGATFTVRLPLTLAIIEGFLVDVAGDTYVIPVDGVHECIELGGEQRQRRGTTGVVNLRGEVLPWIRLRELFGLPHDLRSTRESLLVVRHAGGKAGVVVDQLLGESQIVIKSLGRLFQRVRGVAGSAILGSGRIALILDVATLMRDAIGHQGEHATDARPVT